MHTFLKMDASLIFSVLLLSHTCLGYSVKESFDEIWTGQFDAVHTELGVLKEKVYEGVQLLESIASLFDSVASSCSGEGSEEEEDRPENQENNGQDQADSMIRNLKTEVSGTGHMHERIYYLKDTLTAISNGLDGIHDLTDDAADKLAENIFTIPSLIARKSLQSSSELKERIRDLQTQMIGLEFKLNERIDTAVEKLGQDYQSLSDQVEPLLSMDLNKPGCQSGTFGDHTHPSVPFPSDYVIEFSPAFDKPPKFVYGLTLVDSTAIVRVYAELLEVTSHVAKIQIKSWADTKLYGARVQWMACP